MSNGKIIMNLENEERNVKNSEYLPGGGGLGDVSNASVSQTAS
jgi:hypothetical protein